ncbi:hypothetical protein FBF86_15895 [Serratia marcescens]|uniref:hypothetical protein n=1 Tax=Serratia marcescens TaxID=615 RepID=UPI00114DDD2C|nr:hypothetical protein [Serratia marcescens]QDI19380.1 hypothetical protein FBF86_15895 [Serratia marcescens]QDI29124.1 hypothetical protein FG169_15895 [Serratia marcescens]QDI43629.1 hypothetical protein FG172_16120 [Serratia marcescens]QDI58056.1 hypothetical protein FG175_16120 [Serratia marcescens]
MFKKILLPALFTASLLCSIESTAAINLLQYNKISTVSGLFNDKAVTDSLKSTLGQDYEKYISNFDVFGEPHSVPGGGVFAEGWLKDLYQESASALVINPDGKIYAAWVVPDSDVINYKSSDKDAPMNKEIQHWAERFKNMQFATINERKKMRATKEYFDTQSFSIKLTTICSSKGDCNDATYYGKRKKDGAALTLQGKATRADCNTAPCPIIGYEFKNASTTYMLSKIDNTLTVIKDGKILMNQKGEWVK